MRASEVITDALPQLGRRELALGFDHRHERDFADRLRARIAPTAARAARRPGP